MTSIPNQSLPAGPSPGQNTLLDARFSSYVKKQSVSAYESLDAGLTIQTKEGDRITLTSRSYAQFDASMYNSQGVLQTGSGMAVMTQNTREITLTTGDSFTFSVVGDLSEEELGDIEAIIKGIDEIISKMAKGDMDSAVATALSMGGYDSVSMYSADITYQRSYAMSSETRDRTMTPLPDTGTLSEVSDTPSEPVLVPDKVIPFSENHKPRRKRNNTIQNIDKFMDEIARKLEKADEKLVDKTQKPIDKLFNHHLKDMKKNHHGGETAAYHVIDTARKKMDEMISQMVGKGFKDLFSAFKA